MSNPRSGPGPPVVGVGCWARAGAPTANRLSKERSASTHKTRFGDCLSRFITFLLRYVGCKIRHLERATKDSFALPLLGLRDFKPTPQRVAALATLIDRHAYHFRERGLHPLPVRRKAG